MLTLNFPRQKGLSIIELMVGMTLGLIVVTAAIAAFLGNLRGSSDNLRQARLNEDMNAVMAYMMNDIRRAGYWGTANKDQANPFSEPTTDITINGNCILYSYDAVYSTAYGDINDGDFFGFKLINGGIIQMRTGSTTHDNSACSTASDTWNNLNDPNTLFIDTLTFSFEGSKCVNTSVSTGTTTYTSLANATLLPCSASFHASYQAVAGHTLAEARMVRITLTGHHTSDATLTKTLTNIVSVRNDRIVRL